MLADNNKLIGMLVSVFMLLLGMSSRESTAADEIIHTTIDKLGHRQGLSESTIFSVTKDNKGFIWLGTPNALIRYDGYEFKRFASDGEQHHQLAVSGAGNIFIDSADRIWVGAWGDGLAVYDSTMNLLHHFKHDASNASTLSGNKVQTIFEDSLGRIWIGTNGGGLSLYVPREAKFIRYLHNDNNPFSISHNRVWSITESETGILWVATSRGLNRLDTNVANVAQAQFQHVELKTTKGELAPYQLIRTLFKDSSGQIWLGTQGDFGRFDVDKLNYHQIELPNKMGHAIVNRIIEGRKGDLYIATFNGLYHYHVDKQQLAIWASSGGNQLLPQRDIRDALIDDNGLMWLATRYAGLIKINMTPSLVKSYRHFHQDELKLPMNRVFGISADNEDSIYLATASGLLYGQFSRDNPNQMLEFSRIDLGDKLNQTNITALEIGGGFLWLGGHFGLYSLPLSKIKQFKTSANINLAESLIAQDHILEKVTTKNIQSLAFVEGSLWVGTTHEGLIRVDQSGAITHFATDRLDEDSISGNTIIDIKVDAYSQMWFATASSGVNFYNSSAQKFKRFQTVAANQSDHANYIASNSINDITFVGKDALWIANNKGLNRLKLVNGTIDHFSRDHGLTENNVAALLEDNSGMLWLSSGERIARFDKINQEFIYYEQIIGNSKNQFLPGVAAKTKSGALIFGGTQGVNILLPSDEKLIQGEFNTVLTGLAVDQQDIQLTDLPIFEPLVLDFNHRQLLFTFAALDFTRSENNLYQYRMNGYEANWQMASKRRHVAYGTLPPGDYQLQVKASVDGTQWSPLHYQLDIHVKSPWWQMWWFKLVLFALLLMLCFGAYVFYRRQAMMNNLHMQRQIAERTSVLDESNRALASTIDKLNQSQAELVEQQKMASLGQMVAGIAHEVNTPLGLGITASTVLKQRIDEVKTLFYDKKLKPMHLDKFIQEGSQNTDIIFRNLERAANLIHGFKQVAVDQSTEENREFNVSTLIEETITALSPRLNKVSHLLTYDCSPELTAYSKPGPITQVIINLVNNSLEHAFKYVEDGLMTIDVNVVKDDLVIVYKDNGCGLDKKQQKSIYEPFVTTRRSEGNTGLGMHLVYNIVHQGLGGSIKLKSEPEQGVEFTIKFPKDSRLSDG